MQTVQVVVAQRTETDHTVDVAAADAAHTVLVRTALLLRTTPLSGLLTVPTLNGSHPQSRSLTDGTLLLARLTLCLGDLTPSRVTPLGLLPPPRRCIRRLLPTDRRHPLSESLTSSTLIIGRPATDARAATPSSSPIPPARSRAPVMSASHA